MSLLKDKIEIAVEEAELEAGQKFTVLPRPYKWAIIIAVVGIIPGYLLAKTISHAYWSHKYQQYLITAKPSFENPLAPRVEQVVVNQLAGGTYSVVAVVDNDNLDLSLNNQNYQFRLFDTGGSPITPDNQAPLSGKMYLLAGQKKYIVVPRVESSRAIAKATLSFTGQLNWQKKRNVPNIDFLTTSPSTYNQLNPPAFITEGEVVNQSPYFLNQVTINLILLDSNNKIIGGNITVANSIKPNERRAYKALWPNLSTQNISKVLVAAETNTLDTNNLSLPAGGSNPATDLNRPQTSPF